MSSMTLLAHFFSGRVAFIKILQTLGKPPIEHQQTNGKRSSITALHMRVGV